MNLKKLPPSMVMLLGLGVEVACGPCLTPPDPTSTGTDSGQTSRSTETTGPCLSPPFETTTDSATGTVEPSTSTGDSDTDAGTGTGTDADTGTDDGSGTDTGAGSDTNTGPCLVPVNVPAEPPSPLLAPAEVQTTGVDSRRAAVERVLGRDALPADVASRLRSVLDD